MTGYFSSSATNELTRSIVFHRLKVEAFYEVNDAILCSFIVLTECPGRSQGQSHMMLKSIIRLSFMPLGFIRIVCCHSLEFAGQSTAYVQPKKKEFNIVHNAELCRAQLSRFIDVCTFNATSNSTIFPTRNPPHSRRSINSPFFSKQREKNLTSIIFGASSVIVTDVTSF